MEQSSSYDEETIRHQFDRKCKLALQGEKIDYERHLSYRQKHEVLFCELPETEFWKLSTVDEYTAESYFLTDEQFCTFRINGAPFPRQRCKRLAPAVRYPFVVTC